jgi:hypothetical protein
LRNRYVGSFGFTSAVVDVAIMGLGSAMALAGKPIARLAR